MSENKQRLSPKELAERWGTSYGYLSNRRSAGLKPDYIRDGSSVFYSLESVLDYEQNYKRKKS